MRIKFCPKCKDSDLVMVAGAHIGMWRCKKCGFTGAIFPEKEIEKPKKKKK
ncbi:MAG: hypothetical protein ABIE22_03510 [archaeon]